MTQFLNIISFTVTVHLIYMHAEVIHLMISVIAWKDKTGATPHHP